MDADFDLGLDGVLTPSTGHGGARRGAGRPKGSGDKKMNAALADELGVDGDEDTEGTDAYARVRAKLAVAKADKERALADQAALKFRVDSGEYLSRTAFREASATLVSTLAQGLRGLPDLLERRAALSVDQAQIVEREVDDALRAIAHGMSLFTEQAPPA